MRKNTHTQTRTGGGDVCVRGVSQCAKFNVPKAAHKQSANVVSQRPLSCSLPLSPASLTQSVSGAWQRRLDW